MSTPRFVSLFLSALFLVSNMFELGLQSSSQLSRRARWALIARALAFDLLAVPAIVIAVTRLLGTPSELTIALVLLAVSPGGALQPRLSRVAGAEVMLSAQLDLTLARISMFSAPLLAGWLLVSEQPRFQELPLIGELILLQMVPLTCGKIIRRRTAMATRLQQPVHLVATASLVALLAIVIAQRGLRTLWLIGSRGWLATILIAAASIVIGWLIAGVDRRARITIAISANSRQLALALVLASVGFPERDVRLLVFGSWVLLEMFNLAFAVLFARPRLRMKEAP